MSPRTYTSPRSILSPSLGLLLSSLFLAWVANSSALPSQIYKGRLSGTTDRNWNTYEKPALEMNQDVRKRQLTSPMDQPIWNIETDGTSSVNPDGIDYAPLDGLPLTDPSLLNPPQPLPPPLQGASTPLPGPRAGTAQAGAPKPGVPLPGQVAATSQAGAPKPVTPLPGLGVATSQSGAPKPVTPPPGPGVATSQSGAPKPVAPLSSQGAALQGGASKSGASRVGSVLPVPGVKGPVARTGGPSPPKGGSKTSLRFRRSHLAMGNTRR